MSYSQRERTKGGGVLGGGQFLKMNKGEQGGVGGQNSGILSEHTFWMSPYCFVLRDLIPVNSFKYVMIVKLKMHTTGNILGKICV